MRQAGEPTVEEILESIKKVIARDNRTGAVEERRHREEIGVAPQARIAETDDYEDEEDDVLDLAQAAEYHDESGAAPTSDDSDNESPPLINEGSRASMRESLAALAMLAEPGVPPQIVRSGETSLEALTRELLRPALAQWLEANLPPLVERMVAAEIARIVGKRG